MLTTYMSLGVLLKLHNYIFKWVLVSLSCCIIFDIPVYIAHGSFGFVRRNFWAWELCSKKQLTVFGVPEEQFFSVCFLCWYDFNGCCGLSWNRLGSASWIQHSEPWESKVKQSTDFGIIISRFYTTLYQDDFHTSIAQVDTWQWSQQENHGFRWWWWWWCDFLCMILFPIICIHMKDCISRSNQAICDICHLFLSKLCHMPFDQISFCPMKYNFCEYIRLCATHWSTLQTMFSSCCSSSSLLFFRERKKANTGKTSPTQFELASTSSTLPSRWVLETVFHPKSSWFKQEMFSLVLIKPYL